MRADHVYDAAGRGLPALPIGPGYRPVGYNMVNAIEFSRKSLAQIQASSGSGPSESEGAVPDLTAPRRNAGIRQPSASQK